MNAMVYQLSFDVSIVQICLLETENNTFYKMDVQLHAASERPKCILLIIEQQLKVVE